MTQRGEFLSQPDDVMNLLKLSIGKLEHEVFGVILMDVSNRYVNHEVLFRGTLLHTAVSPREVVKYALKHNASRAIFYHNHPTGSLQPSPGDRELTKILKDILFVIDVLVVDHIIVAGTGTMSFQANGLMP